MAEPYVPIARYTTANTLLTALETSLATIDDDSDLILADATAAAVSATAALNTEKEMSLSLMLGGA
jgi:hypothetical protein